MRGKAGFAASVLVVCFVALALRGVWGQDATSDERHYFGAGREILRARTWTGYGARLHPPLSYYVQSLPLLGRGESSADDPVALFLCRVTSLLVFGVPMLVVVFRWARQCFGAPAGLLALALVAFSPTVLAHAPLLTPDVPLAATGLLALYLLDRAGHGAGRPWAWGLGLGLCLLTKLGAWLFVAAVIVDGGLTARRQRDRAIVIRLGAGLLVAYVTLLAGYGFAGMLDTKGKAELIARVPDAPLARLAARVASPFLPLPYLKAAGTQLSIGWNGWDNYLLGEVSRKGWWYYFLVALAAKETIPFLVLLVAGLATFPWKTGRREALFLLLPPLLFFTVFSLGRVQIGIRYVLPAFPFLCIAASSLARAPTRRRLATVAALAALHAAAALLASPDFIAYFNALAGGPANGYRWLADSNLDWGQNRTRVQTYAREHGITIEPDVLPTTGRVAVRVNRLVGIGDPETYRLLREQYDPVGNVGYNWLIYDLTRRRGSDRRQ
jgi:4-amino-4-deoxy-L-arabinose transferase-like glycosyltransferase